MNFMMVREVWMTLQRSWQLASVGSHYPIHTFHLQWWDEMRMFVKINWHLIRAPSDPQHPQNLDFQPWKCEVLTGIKSWKSGGGKVGHFSTERSFSSRRWGHTSPLSPNHKHTVASCPWKSSQILQARVASQRILELLNVSWKVLKLSLAVS